MDAFRVFLAREPDHEYSVDHVGDYFFVRTNWNAPNFRLMRAPVGASDRARRAGRKWSRAATTSTSRTSRCFAIGS